MFAPFIISAVLVAVAELGDKTQMLTLMLACRHGARRVLIGVGLAILALQLLAVLAGGIIGSLIPETVLAWVTGLLFIGFGVWTLLARDDAQDVEETAEEPRGLRSPVLATAAAFFLAELGDKTQIMTMTIAADPAAAGRSLGAFGAGLSAGATDSRLPVLVAVWLGSTLGMLLVNGAAALVGSAVGARLSPRLIKRVSGVVFIIFGVAAIASLFLRG